MNNEINFEMTTLELAHSYTGKLDKYDPFKDLKKKLINIDDRLASLIISEGKAALNKKFPVIYASDYMRFKKDGNRADFENIYFEKRHMLSSLVLAEYLEDNGEYLPHIIDGIYSICEETSWCLPAHNTYIRDTPQIILPDKSRPVLDLFACETGELMAMVLYLLADKLNEVSELICKMIRGELHERIIKPYLNEHFWWMGRGSEPMCNWTPWCTGNVLLCAFLANGMDYAQDTLKRIFIKAAASVDFFLKDYGEDGCCDEGAQYYKHAGLCLFHDLELLNAVSHNTFEALYDDVKIKNIAAYIALVHVDGPWYFNFSDCSPKAGLTGVREFLFGKHTKQNFLCSFAAKDYYDSVINDKLLNDESLKLNLYYRTQAFYYSDEILNYCKNNNVATYAPNIYYPSVGLIIVRNKTFTLAVKAGDNDDSHNHNDTGSITLYKNGHPVLVDIGVETYTGKTFSPDRYDIWTMQSGYHNLPTIMGLDQEPGANHRATHIHICNEKGEDISKAISEKSSHISISMNLENAYPDKISSNYYYKRNVVFDYKKNQIRLNDKTDAKDVILNFISYEEPHLTISNSYESRRNEVAAEPNKPSDASDVSNSIIEIGESRMEFTGAQLITIETLPITDARLKTAWDHDLYRIRLGLKKDFLMTIS